jgi:hypothetical protein
MSHVTSTSGIRSPGQLDAFFTRSMALALAAIGRAAGLEALDWRARTLQHEVVLQGTPARGAQSPTQLCERWAAALGLDEFSYDGLEGVSTWSRYESPWLIEVSSETH